MVEVYISLITANIHTIIKVELVYCWVSMLMVTIEVNTGLRLATLLPIIMVENVGSTQGYINMLFLGVCEETLFKTITKVIAYIRIK